MCVVQLLHALLMVRGDGVDIEHAAVGGLTVVIVIQFARAVATLAGLAVNFASAVAIRAIAFVNGARIGADWAADEHTALLHENAGSPIDGARGPFGSAGVRNRTKSVTDRLSPSVAQIRLVLGIRDLLGGAADIAVEHAVTGFVAFNAADAASIDDQQTVAVLIPESARPIAEVRNPSA